MKGILIAGIGNIFHGDDAFGVELAQALARRPLPKDVRVEDFGIRAYDLAYALMEPRQATILVDATPRGEPPGTLYLIEPDLSQLDQLAEEPADAHNMNPVTVLRMIRSFDGDPGRLYVVGCEPEVLETEGGRIGLSPKVQAALPQAIGMIEDLLRDLIGNVGPVGKEVYTDTLAPSGPVEK